MIVEIDADLLKICRQILAHDHREKEWAGLESGDMFQRGRYCGGFDADDMFFAFSYDDDENIQWSLSLSLLEVHDVVSGNKTTICVDRWDDLMKALED